MPRETPRTDQDLSRPPVRRYAGPIVDCHTHVHAPEEARLLLDVAESFGVGVVCGVTALEAMEALREALGDRFRPILQIEHGEVGRPERFASENIRRILAARALGAVAAKFWYSPRFVAETGVAFDHPSLHPILETLAEVGMPALVHVADPDTWFAAQYADRARYGTKEEHLAHLEATLERFPGLKVLGAHFGGTPEDLGRLGRLLDRYPNYHVDTSATKWVARELSRRPAEARALVLARADRILFGTDLVVFAEATAGDYASRYWVHRWLWEGEGVRPSPIPDPSAPWPDGPRVHGLALPDDVLAKLYAANARQLLGIEV